MMSHAGGGVERTGAPTHERRSAFAAPHTVTFPVVIVPSAEARTFMIESLSGYTCLSRIPTGYQSREP
jgi:hypothetical protein